MEEVAKPKRVRKPRVSKKNVEVEQLPLEAVASGVADDGARSGPEQQPVEEPVEQPEQPATDSQKKKRGPYKPRKPKEVVAVHSEAAAPPNLSNDFWLSLDRTLKALRQESKQKKYDSFVLAR